MTTPHRPSHDDPWWHAPQSPPLAGPPEMPPTPTAQMPAASTGAPRPTRRRRPWIAVALCLAGLFAGATGTVAYDQFTSGSTSVLEQSQAVDEPIGNTPTTTPATTPSTTTPSGRTPSGGGQTPSTTTPSGQSGTTSTASLTKGVVNINTVLAYEQAEAAGTGIVLTSDGQILTNNHVIEGATSITVTVVDTGKEYSATVLGTDASNDVALLQLEDASGLAVANIGDSDTVKVGDAVTGVGNAGGTGVPTASKGVVTDLGQTITATDESGGNAETLHNLIEISAQLQPGQSGGPLFDAAGKVVGVDSAGSTSSPFRSRGRGGATITGSGYAIPINDALAIVEQIRSGEGTDTVTIGTPPMLGVGVADATPVGSGARVISVAEGTPAATLGLAAGDVITAIGGTAVTSADQLGTVLHSHEAGDKVKVTWSSGGTTRSATATLIAGPAS